MKLLAIETATDTCSCAIGIDEKYFSRELHAPRQHAELVLAMVEELLEESGLVLSGLDGVAFGRGPGSFTGVRIAAGVVQGLAFGASLPVVGVSSLLALAEGVRRKYQRSRVLVAFDARMSEVYWGSFIDQAGRMSPVIQEGVFPPGEVPSAHPPGDWFGAGDGWGVYEHVLRQRLGNSVDEVDAELYPSAIDVAVLGAACFERGESVSAENALPVYLRDTVTRSV